MQFTFYALFDLEITRRFCAGRDSVSFRQMRAEDFHTVRPPPAAALRVGVVPCIEISSSGVFLVYLSGFPTLLENCLLSKQASCRSDAGAPNYKSRLILSIGTFLIRRPLKNEKIIALGKNSPLF